MHIYLEESLTDPMEINSQVWTGLGCYSVKLWLSFGDMENSVRRNLQGAPSKKKPLLKQNSTPSVWISFNILYILF